MSYVNDFRYTIRKYTIKSFHGAELMNIVDASFDYFNVKIAPEIQKLQILVNKHKILTCLKDNNWREEDVCNQCPVYKLRIVPCILNPSFGGQSINYTVSGSAYSSGPNLNTCKEPISNIDDIKNIIKQIEEHFRK